MKGSHHPRRYWIWSSALTLAAFAIRLWGLTATSLWYDETFMLYHAQQGVVEGVAGLLREDNSLPLHGLLLALWVGAVGGGEFAARYLSVLLGTLAIPLVTRLAGALARKRWGGWGAAAALATLPIHVYYAQEVRMYALAVPLGVTFAWIGVRVARTGRCTGGYVVTGALMLLAHLYTGLLWAAVLLWGTPVALSLNKERRSRWMGANLMLGLAALPIAGWGLWRTGVDATAVRSISPTVLGWLPDQFGVGQYLADPWSAIFLTTAGLSLGLALVQLIRTRRGDAALWIAVTFVVPGLLLLAAAQIKPKWSERYLLPSLGLALVIGVGLGWELATRQARVAGALLTLTWVAVSLPALARQAEGVWALAVHDECHPRPDFRAVARYIEEHDAPDDAIVVVAGYAAHTLAYYYDGPARLFGLPPDVRILDTRRPLDLRSLRTLERKTGDARRLWLVLWQDHLADPTSLVQSLLVEFCPRLPVGENFTNVGVLLFDVTACRPLDALATPPHPLAEPFAEPIELVGYGLTQTEETWELDLWWRAVGYLDHSYRVFVHLRTPEGELVDQHDHIAGADLYPTDQWVPGTLLRDRFFLEVPEGLCPGCAFHVGLYTDEARLGLKAGGDTVVLPVP